MRPFNKRAAVADGPQGGVFFFGDFVNIQIKLVKAASALAVGSMAAFLLTAPASAATVTFNSNVSVSDSSFSPDMHYASSGLDATLTVGTPFTINNFITVHVDDTISSHDDVSGSISAVFNFTDPTAASGTDHGSISATIERFSDDHINISWNDPITILFTDGTKLLVNLADVNFNCGSSCTDDDSFHIAGTFTALNGPADGPGLAETPLPGTLPLFVSGLGAMGLLMRRKKRKV